MSKRRDVDPHKRDMRSRFKRLVRAVMINRQWLDEPDEQAQGISMNVKKNLAFLVRQKRKTGILTVAIVRACSYGLLIQYDPLQFIYSDNRGAVSYVHFILSGECTILQCLKMRVLRNVGKITYDLVKVNNADGFDLDAKTSKTRLRDSEVEVSNSDFNLDDLLASTDSQDAETLQEKKAKRKIGLREVEIACGYGGIQLKRKIHRNPRRTVLRRRTTYVARRLTSFGKTTSSTARASSMHGDDDEDYFPEDAEDEYDYIPEDYFVEEEISVEETPTTERTTMKSMISSNRSTARSTLKSLRQSEGNVLRVETDDSMNQNTPRDTYISPTVNVVPETETRFVDVGSLTYGGIFGLGETIVHRVIMARTVVQCMLLPRFWLMEPDQNPGHIWKRRKFYLEGCVPSREELFGNFLKTRRWEKFKHDYVQSTLNPNSVNSTQPEDIPIISRIVETRDDI
ncbi:uncharacterized protein LOC133847017 isoform X2 [Drosophila sulfurigaster albostrigata]|uniref:uncharacterized protein LOC133847017 isoform X2 n=1 Tax=Drosophila sulfurigaster albostrigata TaxID=89887 RepID=UPI002D21D62A|nr:uncharacterized protein LOC133847017 isoform X2 [Drosophila sulfurigaster albostrigata]